jgi:3-phosphoshikimate 1-carboxyvinyltransferase
MKIAIRKSHVQGTAGAPPSKSYTIRGLMCAALAHGQSSIRNPLLADDTSAALEVLGRIGVRVETGRDAWNIFGGHFKTPSEALFCGESAATLRFMTAICSLVPGESRLTAGLSLSRRPVRPLAEALRRWGVDSSCAGDFAPVTVTGGGLKGGLTEIPGDISSQFVSALLLIAPLAAGISRIHLSSPLESQSYVEMTLECLQRFGIAVEHSHNWLEYTITPQQYNNAGYVVEGDWSSASYLLALGATAGPVRVNGLNLSSLQGDRAILDFLTEMGTSITATADEIKISRNRLKALKADLNECIDLLPTLAALAALAEGTSEFSGIQRARLKESDRISSVKEGLEKLGIKVVEGPDRLTITGANIQPATINSHNDHRIAMAFSIIGAASGGLTIDGAECISKTYPEYWDTIRSLGVKIDEQYE